VFSKILFTRNKKIEMTIANPIYDIVFKYLMEDLEIAKGLLSTILDVEITELAMQPQETISETPHENKSIRVFRIDFSATIKQKDGKIKKVLIELQKTKRSANVVRFRRYLADNYQKEDTIIVNGIEKKQSLEIITIYLLGFVLDKISTSVLHGNPCYRDVITNETVKNAKDEEFVNLLTHESYFIQIPKLVEPTKTRIEKILSVFNQTHKSDNEHSLIYEKEADDPLLKRMLTRLTRAIADDTMRRRMNIEDEIERDYQEIEDKFTGIIEEKNQVIEQKDQEIEQKDLLIEELKRQLGILDK
jgi:hypothetical protein